MNVNSLSGLAGLPGAVRARPELHYDCWGENLTRLSKSGCWKEPDLSHQETSSQRRLEVYHDSGAVLIQLSAPGQGRSDSWIYNLTFTRLYVNPSHIIADEQGNVGPVVKRRSTLHKTFSGSHQTLNDKQGNEDIEEEEKFLEEEMKTECDHVNKPPISVRSVSLAAIQRAQMVCVCY